MNQKKVFKIGGMHCASCASIIEVTLREKPGVLRSDVNFATESLYLEYDPLKIELEDIFVLIKKIGYELYDVDTDKALPGGEVHRLEKEKQKLLFSFLFALPVIFLSISGMIGFSLPERLLGVVIFLQIFCSTVVIWLSKNIWKSGFRAIFRLSPNMDSLIFIGTATAYFYSIFVILFSYLLNYSINLDKLYFESAVFILIFILFGKYLENATKGKTNQAIKKLMGLQPKTAVVIRDGKEVKISISDLKIGDLVLIKPGERIPTDGVIIEGYSGVDEKMITGESMPVEKTVGNQVIGATINKTGILLIKTEKIGKNTVLSQIIKITSDAIGSKPPIQLLVDKISLYFVPLVILVAFISFFVWLLLGASFVFAMNIFVSVLVIACPCALGLATPTAVIVGFGLAAQNGILIKNSNALEASKKINLIAFDKTGTLTKGEPTVTDILAFGKLSGKNLHHNDKDDNTNDQQNVLMLAASIEKNSEHPLASAITKLALDKNVVFQKISSFRAIPGVGVSGKIKNSRLLLGTRKLLIENDILLNKDINKKISGLEAQGKTTMILAKDKDVIGAIAVSDTLKDSSQEAVKLLRSIGKQIVVITGDNQIVASAIGKQINADQIISEVLPGEKAGVVKNLQAQGNMVAMVGDGINDAPALAQADLGISLSSGTDIAIEAGEIILIKNDLKDIYKAIRIGQFTIHKIKQNLFWAFFYNTISIPIAFGLLYSAGILLTPPTAAAAMAFSSVSVVLNSLSMRRFKP